MAFHILRSTCVPIAVSYDDFFFFFFDKFTKYRDSYSIHAQRRLFSSAVTHCRIFFLSFFPTFLTEIFRRRRC